MAIEFSRAAEDDLSEIFIHGILHHGHAQAGRYKRLLEKSFQTLSDQPRIARLRPDIIPPVRVHPAGQHLIIYTILADLQTVFVLRVRHHREDWLDERADGA